MNETEKFLENFPGHLIATLDDKSSRGAWPRREALPELISNQKRKDWSVAELQSLNQKGAGIFFAYNKIGQARSIENVERINAWAMEIDDIPKEEQMKKLYACPISPSIIVESSNSYHAYWLAKDAKLENAKKINKGLIQHFGSDKALSDISRLLRIPGFYHNKKEPFMVRIELADYGQRFTEEEMLECYPYTEKAISIPKRPAVDTDDFWFAANSINGMVALERLSGSSLAAGEMFTFRPRTGGGFYIFVNGEPADAWVDADGRIGSPKGGGPSIVNWLKYYGNDFKSIADWLKENCKDLLPARLFEVREKKWEVKPSDEKKPFVPYTWGTPELDRGVWAMKRFEVVCLAGVTSSGKTAYAFHLAIENAKLGHRVCYAVLEMSAKEIKERAASDAADFSITEDRLEDFPENKTKIYSETLKKLDSVENLVMLDLPSVPIEEVYERIMAAGEFDLIFIDNFDRIGKTKGMENDYQSDNHKIQTILNFTKETNIPQMLVHHINAKKVMRKGGYGLSDLRGSGEVPDECNTVFFLSRDLRKEANDEEKAKFFIQAKKHRRKGQLKNACIYFNQGSFSDSYLGRGIPSGGNGFYKDDTW
jgi:hypothetical protein